MRFNVAIYFNLGQAADGWIGAQMRGYRPGDGLQAGDDVDIPAESAAEAAERAWAHFNHDERPNRFHERSLCAGDVVRVASYDSDERSWWSYARLGVVMIDGEPGDIREQDRASH